MNTSAQSAADLDRIIERVRKCLALSKSSEPHEAAAAMRQAQKLMELHGIDATTIEVSQISETEVRSRTSTSRVKPWESELVNMIARAFGLQILWSPSSSYLKHLGANAYFGKWIMIGLKPQVMMAEHAYLVLSRQLTAQRGAFIKTLPAHLSRDDKARQGDGFAHGWVDAVRATVHEYANTDEVKPVIEKYMAVKYPQVGKAKQQRNDAGAYGFEHGAKAGAGVSLHRAVNGEQQRALGHKPE